MCFFWTEYKGMYFQTKNLLSVDSLLILHWRLQKKANTMQMFGKGEETVAKFIVTKIT